MSSLMHDVRARVRAIWTFLFRAIRLLFILGLVMLPVPVASVVVVLLKPFRRNLPTELLRK